MSRIVMTIGLVIVLGGLVFYSMKSSFAPPAEQVEEVHYHAGFQVYRNNELMDFSGLEYMHLEPCSEGTHEEAHTLEDEQLERAHLHDNIGDVVHVHRDGVVWGDLFRNLDFKLEPTEVYVNGELLEEGFLGYPIKEYDSVVVFEGENDDVEGKLAGAVTPERIEETENRSESCGN